MTVEEALKNGKISMDLLDKYGVEYIKKEKQNRKYIIKRRGKSLTHMLKLFFSFQVKLVAKYRFIHIINIKEEEKCLEIVKNVIV